MVRFETPEKKNDKPKFSYRGVFVEDLDSVLHGKGEMDGDELYFEVNDRLASMYEFCNEHDLFMTNTHMAVALGVSAQGLSSLERGATRRLNRQGVDMAPEIGQCIQSWKEKAKMAAMDISKKDTIPSRSIYLMKSQFHQWDTPQASDDKSVISVEVVLKEAKERREREKRKLAAKELLNKKK